MENRMKIRQTPPGQRTGAMTAAEYLLMDQI